MDKVIQYCSELRNQQHEVLKVIRVFGGHKERMDAYAELCRQGNEYIAKGIPCYTTEYEINEDNQIIRRPGGGWR